MEEEFKNIVKNIKNEIKATQTKILYHANNELIMLYFRIGRIIEDNSRYGNSFIKNLALEIKVDFDNSDGFSERNLKRMKRFYNEYKEYENVPQAVAQLPWGHNIILFEKIKDKNDNPTIGLILCKDKDKFIAQYSLKDINKPIGISSFKLKDYLPTEEDLNMYIDLEKE